MGTFTVDLERFKAKSLKQVDMACRKIALEVYKGVIMSTPVDTGRARGNWQASVSNPASGQSERLDPIPVGMPGGGAFNEAITASRTWKPLEKSSFFLSNNLPYIGLLNEGTSRQAPKRFVELNIMRAGGIAQDAVNGALE